jgi:hypothetical protein
LVQLSESDGALLESDIQEQLNGGSLYPVDENAYKKLASHRVRRADKGVTVTVPEDSNRAGETTRTSASDVRESMRIQALLPEIGSRMGMQIWVPRADCAAVLAEWQGNHPPPLERLLLNYDDTTLKTVEQIDMLWLKGRAIKRAFEVEHTTSIYSGILRMADLLGTPAEHGYSTADRGTVG